MSQLSALIDNTENSIISNITTLKLHRQITPIYNVTSNYQIDIGNPIYNSGISGQSIISTGFYSAESNEICYIEDYPTSIDSDTGTLRMFYINTDGNKVFMNTVGTVNYLKGLINIDNINVTGLYRSIWNFIIKPKSNDVVSTQNQFVRIDPTLLKITPVIDTPNKTYTFTSSRN